MTSRCLSRILKRLGGVLGRLVASWKCLGASEERIYFLLKVQGLKVLIFEGFNEVRGRPGGEAPHSRYARIRSLKRNEGKEERVGRREGRR